MSAPRTRRARRAARRMSQAVTGVDVQPLEPRVLFAGFSAAFYDSLYWGVSERIYPADPNPADVAVPGGATADVGSIRLNDSAPPDPADPLGIAAPDPDAVRVIDTGSFSYVYSIHSYPPEIRQTFSTVFTARLTVPSDGDAVPGEERAIAFNGNSNRDAHVYVDGRLVWTNPLGQGAYNAANFAPPRLYREGQSLDVVMLTANITSLKWSFGDTFTSIPGSAIDPVPSVPQKSGIAVSAAPTDRQVTFAITDNSTSEQRFELYRKAAGAPDADYVKVNEAGINSPLITDASARPATSYTYVLRGHNFASGTGEASEPVTVTTAADAGPRQGLHAYYYNDEFWGRGELGQWPLPSAGDLYVGAGAAGTTGADVYELVTTSALSFGNDEHDPAIRPGGSPHPLIRDASHSIVLAGKLRVDQSGEYEILGYGEDDTYVVVDNAITSAFAGSHILFDPRPHPNPNTPTRFTHRVHLDAGQHDLLVLNTTREGASAVELRWVRPGGTSAELIPAENLSTGVTAPGAPGAPGAPDRRGTNALIVLDDNATSEWKNVLVVARDAGFTQDVRTFPFGILVDTGSPGGNPSSLRVFDLQPNTRYFAKHVALNGEGESASAVTEFDSGPELVPATPTGFSARPRGPGEIYLSWNDAAFDETGYVVQRKVGDGAWLDLATLGAGATGYADLPDPAQVPHGTFLEYRVAAFNNAGRADTGARSLTFGGPGGTGLRMRIWDNIHSTANEGVGAPAVDRVDPFVSHDWGSGAPAPGIQGDTFAIEWVGEIIAEETKAYDFSVIADRGARLFLNDVLVTRGPSAAWQFDGAWEDFAEPVGLTAGQKVKVRLQYHEGSGVASARLRWNGPAGREDIPSVFLFPALGPADAVDQVARRPITFPAVFGLPPALNQTTANIAVRWQDNAFSETGYEIQRATDALFTQNLTTISGGASPAAGPGSELFVDDGSSISGNPGPLDRETRYYYRIRPAGASDAAWVNAGSAKPDRATASTDFRLNDFSSAKWVTVHGDASTTAEKTLKLAHNQNFRTGSAFLNGSFDVAADFFVNFDFQISNSTGADGMTFVIHNHRPAGARTSQLGVIGGTFGDGSSLGYRNIPNSVAITLDVHEQIDQIGLFTNGAVPAYGNVPATRASTPATWPLEPNGTIDLRLPMHGAIDLNNGAVYDLRAFYNNATKVLDIQIRLASADPESRPLFRTQFQIDLAATIGSDEAVMGFTAANGGLNSRYEVHNFSYDRPTNGPCRVCEPWPPVSQVYVRGTSWFQPSNLGFRQWLEANGYGDDVLGYRVDNLPADTTIPWTNVDQIVVRFVDANLGGIPSWSEFTVDGTHGAYQVTNVTPAGTDPFTYVLTLNRPLGVLPAPQVGAEGDRVTLRVAGGAGGAADFTLPLNVLQGDANRANGRVTSTDVTLVRSRLNRSADEATPPGGAQPYTAFADLNGDGRINSTDVTAVRARLNDTLAASPTIASILAMPVPGAALFSARRIRPDDRDAFADLLA